LLTVSFTNQKHSKPSGNVTKSLAQTRTGTPVSCGIISISPDMIELFGAHGL